MSNHASQPEICLPSLKHLLIHPDATQTLLLELLTCPSITLVEITGYKDHYHETMQGHAQTLGTMLRRSNVQYANFKLALGKHMFDHWTASGALRKLPLLQHLQITTVTSEAAIESPSFGWPTSLKSMAFREPPTVAALLSWLHLLQPRLEKCDYAFIIYVAGDPVDGDDSASEVDGLLRGWGMGFWILPQNVLDSMGFSDAAIVNHEYRNQNWR
jgi:hypothetical protein